MRETEVDRDDGHLRGKHQTDQHHKKEAIAAAECQPCEGESRERASDKLAEGDEDETDEEINIPPDKPIISGPLPSADSLIRSVEELLRKERENNQNDSGFDEESE